MRRKSKRVGFKVEVRFPSKTIEMVTCSGNSTDKLKVADAMDVCKENAVNPLNIVSQFEFDGTDTVFTAWEQLKVNQEPDPMENIARGR